MSEYIDLDNLEVYKLARVYSRDGWKVYSALDWRIKKIIGDQMIESVDSVGANIAEGYGRFHYLDKIKFYYNARGSLLEAKHWIDVMFERCIVEEEYFNKMAHVGNDILIKLNSLIRSQHDRKLENRN